MQHGVQRPGRKKIVPERFLEHDAHPAVTLQEIHLIQPFHHGRNNVRRQGEVEDPVLRHAVRPLQPPDESGQSFEILGRPLANGLIVNAGVAPVPEFVDVARAGRSQPFERPEAKGFLAHLGQGRSDDQRVLLFQQSLIPQMIKRRQELPAGQIARPPQDDEHMRLNRLLLHRPSASKPSTESCSVTLRLLLPY